MKLNLEQRNAIIAQHMPLADKVAWYKKQRLTQVDVEELKSAAYLGLVEAADRYDTDQGEFFRYARYRIVGEVKDYLRGLGFGSRGSVSRGCGRMDSIDSESLAAKNGSDVRSVFEEVTEVLPEQGKRLFWEHFVEGRKMKEIGVSLGVGEARISQLISGYKKQLVA